MTLFDSMGLPQPLARNLRAMGITDPTPIQQEAIPLALEGRDILGSAQTGTGKTAAFGVPLIARLLTDPRGSALVMAPTRELAAQVMKQLRAMLGDRTPVKTALLIGGEAMPKQFRQLDENPRLIVGTPGRINDHLKRRSLSLDDTDFLVLDETDRMLDMGFTIQIETVLEHMPPVRQTLLFSATLPKNIVRITDTYLNDPARVSVAPPSEPAANIDRTGIEVKDTDKYDQLLEALEERNGSVIIFIKTKYGTEKMAKRLTKDGHSADAIHGDLKQNRRDRVIKSFRAMKFRVLVATDVAARGLDIPHIEHVINYDLPHSPEDYIHRIGRTARAGAEGHALDFISPGDRKRWRAIEKLLDPNAVDDDRRERRRPRRDDKRRVHQKQGDQKRGDRKHPARRAKTKSWSPVVDPDAAPAERSDRSERTERTTPVAKAKSNRAKKRFDDQAKPRLKKSFQQNDGDKRSESNDRKDRKDRKPFAKRDDDRKPQTKHAKDRKSYTKQDGKPFAKHGERPGRKPEGKSAAAGKPAGKSSGKSTGGKPTGKPATKRPVRGKKQPGTHRTGPRYPSSKGKGRNGPGRQAA